MKFGVENVVFYFPERKHSTQQFRNFNRCSSYQNRTACIYQLFYFFDNCRIFFALRFVDTVVHIVSDDRFICRDHHHIQFVYIPKLSSFGFSGTGHTGKFVIHSKIILQSDCGISLRSSLNFYALFGFDGLMQSVRITATFHDATGLFVNDFHLIVDHNIFIIPFEERISLEQLVDGVNALGFDGIVLEQFVFFCGLFLFCQIFVLKFRKL